MYLGTTYSPRVSVGGAASYKLWPVFTHSNGYWKVYRHFHVFFGWGGGIEERGYAGEHSTENLSGGGRISKKGAQDILAFFLKSNEKKYGKVFSTESKEQH